MRNGISQCSFNLQLSLYEQVAHLFKGQRTFCISFCELSVRVLAPFSLGLWIFLISNYFYLRGLSSLGYVLQTVFSQFVICLLILHMVFGACV